MIDSALSGVFASSASLHQKRPIAGLRQQKFTGKLFKHAVDESATVFRMLTRQFAHLLRGNVQLGINPFIAWIQPNFKIAVLAPCRGSGLDYLLRRIPRQIFTRCGETEFAFLCDKTYKLFQKPGTFEPPVSE